MEVGITILKCLEVVVAAGSTFLIERGVCTMNVNLCFIVLFLVLIGEGSCSNLQVRRGETFRERRIALCTVLRQGSCLVEAVL